MGRVIHSQMKLGKLPYKHDPRNLRLANYLPPVLPPAPDTYDWLAKASRFGMMLNDTIGDCTCAGAGHMIQVFTANEGKELILPDSVILALYSKLSGYNGDPSTDNGLYLIQVLKEWQQNGIAGHKIGAYVQIDPRNKTHRDIACYLFGGLYCGVALPLSAQGQQSWDVQGNPSDPNSPAAPGSWGGHCVPMGDYDPLAAIFVTWGEEQYVTEAFMQTYFDEMWAVISQDFLDGKQDNPLGVNLDQLNQDLQAVKVM